MSGTTARNPDGSVMLYKAVFEDLFDSVSDEEILAQPCVVEALRKAREDALQQAADQAMVWARTSAEMHMKTLREDYLIESQNFESCADDILQLPPKS